MKLTQIYAADIVKSERDDNGDLMVYGRACNSTLDIDKQVADAEWLKSAMPAWQVWGNVREQHSKVAAGIGLELEAKGEDWWLKSAVIDEGTAKKVERGVLKGYSIGIKNPRVVKDADAPGGRIVGGEVVEVSLVDRPANPDCTIVLAKSASARKGAELEAVDAPEDEPLDQDEDVDKDAEADLAKKDDFTDEQRKAMAAKGQALPGGGYPIPNVAYLKKAIQAIGRAKDPAAAKAHIKKRAAALGQEALIPDTWKAATADQWTHDPAQVADTFKAICALLQAEIDEWVKGEDEANDVSELLCAAQMVANWAKDEAEEGEIPPPFNQTGDDDMSVLTFGVDADIIKAAQADDATDEAKDALRAELQKALGVDADSLGEKIAAVLPDAVKGLFEERSNALEERLARVEGAAAPGGPVTTRTTAETAKTVEADHMRAQAAEYRRLASQVDMATAQGYREKAAECDAAAAKLAAL